MSGRSGPLRVPNMAALGLGAAIRAASDIELPGFPETPRGIWAAATEVSRGKDTPSGHWELAGVPGALGLALLPAHRSGDPAVGHRAADRARRPSRHALQRAIPPGCR